MRAPSPVIPIRSENRSNVLPDLRALLTEMVDGDASDLHLKVPGRPMLRVGRELVSTRHERLMPRDVESYAEAIMRCAGVGPTRDEVRVAFGMEGLGRFRAHVGRQRGSHEVVIHRISTSPPALEELGDLGGMGRALDVGSGLVLVAGSRVRRAILAGGIRHLNEEVGGHVLSIEGPMGWLHRDSRAAVSQREVGIDVPSVADAIASCSWQDPDAVFCADLPTAADAEAALRLAEEGILVVAGIAVADPGEGVRAFVGRFPSTRESEIAARVADVLSGVAGVDRGGNAAWWPMEAEMREMMRAGVVSRW